MKTKKLDDIPTADEFIFDDADWDIGLKGGEAYREIDDWDNSDYIGDFLDIVSSDIPPKGYQPENDSR